MINSDEEKYFPSLIVPIETDVNRCRKVEESPFAFRLFSFSQVLHLFNSKVDLCLHARLSRLVVSMFSQQTRRA